MKRIYIGIFVFVLLLPLSVSAQPDASCILTTLQDVNLRSGPGVSFEILGSRVTGQMLLGIGQATDTEGKRWWDIQNKWVREDLVSEAGPCNTLPTTTPDTSTVLEIITPQNAGNLIELGIIPQTDLWKYLSINSDNSLLAVGTGPNNNQVLIWNLETNSLVREYSVESDTKFAPIVTFAPMGNLLAANLQNEHQIQIFDALTGNINVTIDVSRIVDIKFSPEGQLLASSHGDGAIRLWDVHTGDLIKILKNETCILFCVPISVAFNSLGTQLASGQGTPRIWDIETGEIIGYVPEEMANVVKFSPDDTLLIARNEDEGKINFWDLETRNNLGLLQDFISFSYEFAFGLHENIIAVVMLPDYQSDGSIEVWDTGANTQLIGLQHEGRVSNVLITADGRQIISAGDDGIRIWGIPKEAAA